MPAASAFVPLRAPFSPWEPAGLALLVYAAVVLGLLAVILFLSGFLTRRRPTPEKQRPYECGVRPAGDPRLGHGVPFFLMAVLFLLFDVETAYVLSFAVAWDALGLPGYVRLAVFLAVLGLSLSYAWSKGALDWTEEDSL